MKISDTIITLVDAVDRAADADRERSRTASADAADAVRGIAWTESAPVPSVVAATPDARAALARAIMADATDADLFAEVDRVGIGPPAGGRIAWAEWAAGRPAVIPAEAPRRGRPGRPAETRTADADLSVRAAMALGVARIERHEDGFAVRAPSGAGVHYGVGVKFSRGERVLHIWRTKAD